MSKLIIKPPQLFTYQKKIGDSPKRFTATEACTKIGKTFYHIWWQHMQCFGLDQFGKYYQDVKEGDNHWWVAPSVNQAKIAYKRVKRRVNGVSGHHCHDTNRIITMPVGTEWHFKTGEDPEALYGENVYSVVLDEATRMRKEAWDAVYSTTTSTNALVKLIGNTKATCYWFKDIKNKAIAGNPDWDYFKIDCYDALKEGRLTLEQIELAKRTLDKETFEELYLCIESSGQGQLSSNNDIARIFTNKVERGKKYLTADIAFEGADLFVIGIWEGWVLTHIYTIKKSTPDEVVVEVEKRAIEHGVGPRQIAYDGDGIGMYLNGFLANSINFMAGAPAVKEPEQKNKMRLNYKNINAQVIYHLAFKINNHEIACVADIEGDVKERIKTELKFLRSKGMDVEKKLQVWSSTEIKEVLKASPDYLVMMKLRAALHLQEKKAASFF